MLGEVVFILGWRIYTSKCTGWPRVGINIEKDGSMICPVDIDSNEVNVMANNDLGVATVGGGPVLRVSGPLFGVGWHARIVILEAWLPPQLLLLYPSRRQLFRIHLYLNAKVFFMFLTCLFQACCTAYGQCAHA